MRTKKPVRSQDDDASPLGKSCRTMAEPSDEDTDGPAKKDKEVTQEPPRPLDCSCGKDYKKCTAWSTKNHQVTCSCGEIYRQKKAFMAHLSECTDIFMNTSC